MRRSEGKGTKKIKLYHPLHNHFYLCQISPYYPSQHILFCDSIGSFVYPCACVLGSLSYRCKESVRRGNVRTEFRRGKTLLHRIHISLTLLSHFIRTFLFHSFYSFIRTASPPPPPLKSLLFLMLVCLIRSCCYRIISNIKRCEHNNIKTTRHDGRVQRYTTHHSKYVHSISISRETYLISFAYSASRV